MLGTSESKLNKWQSSLMDMSRRNPLLAFKSRLTSTLQIMNSQHLLFEALLGKKNVAVRDFFPFDELIRQAEAERKRLADLLTDEVNIHVRNILKGLLDDYGWAVVSDVHRLERKIRHLLEDIPVWEALVEAARFGTVPSAVTNSSMDYPAFEKYRRSLVSDGMDPYLAEWALKMWLEASGSNFSLEDVKKDASNEEEKSKQQVVVEQEIERLEKRLNKIRLSSQLIMRERGISVLYVAFGFLRWYEDDSANEWVSPLFLVPVMLNRNSNGVTFIQAADDEVLLNPMLIHKLKTAFQLELPKLPEDTANLPLQTLLEPYLKLIQSDSRFRGWTVLMDTYLCNLSFNKLAMYQDFERHMNLMLEHPIIRRLTGEEDETNRVSNDIHLPVEIYDREGRTEESFHVLDADSSQWQTLLDAKQGRSFIIQGPPGTGKSQTIANIIAEMLAQNKSVLFMSEKMTALEVVKNRLAKQGLDPFCLELHNNKINKKHVLDELKKTYQLDEKKHVPLFSLTAIDSLKQKLNRYIDSVHKPIEPLGLTPYEVFGRLSRVSEVPNLLFSIQNVDQMTAYHLEQIEQFMMNLDLSKEIFSNQQKGLWESTLVKTFTLDLETRLKQRFPSLAGSLERVQSLLTESFHEMGIGWPVQVNRMATIQELECSLRNVPDFLESWFTNHSYPSLQQSGAIYEEAKKKFELRKRLTASLEQNFRQELLLQSFQQFEDTLCKAHSSIVNESGMNRDFLIQLLWDHSEDLLRKVQALTVTYKELAEAIHQAETVWVPLKIKATVDNARQLSCVYEQLERITSTPSTAWLHPDSAMEALNLMRQARDDSNYLSVIGETVNSIFTESVWKLEITAMKQRFEEKYMPYFTSVPALEQVWGNTLDDHESILSVENLIKSLQNEYVHAMKTFGFEPFSFSKENVLWVLEQLLLVGQMESLPTEIWFQHDKRDLVKKQLNAMPGIIEQIRDIQQQLEEQYEAEAILADAAAVLSLIDKQYNVWFHHPDQTEGFWEMKEQMLSYLDELLQAISKLEEQHRYACEYFGHISFSTDELKGISVWLLQLSVLRFAPPENWFDPQQYELLRSSAVKANKAVTELIDLEHSLMDKYEENILNIPLEEIEKRMVSDYSSPIKRLVKRGYSRDREQMQYYLRNQHKLDYQEMKQDLKLCLKVVNARDALETDRTKYEQWFGQYYKGKETDWVKLNSDLELMTSLCGEVAFKGISLVSFRQNFEDTLAKGIPLARLQADFAQRVEDIQQLLSIWEMCLDKVAEYIRLPNVAGSPDLHAFKNVLYSFHGPFVEILGVYNRMQTHRKEQVAPSHGLNKWRSELSQMESLQLLKKQVSTLDQLNTFLFGRSYKQLETDWEQIKRDMTRLFSLLDSCSARQIQIKSLITLWSEWSSQEEKWADVRSQLCEKAEKIQQAINELEGSLNSVHDGLIWPYTEKESESEWEHLLSWFEGYRACANQYKEDLKRLSACRTERKDEGFENARDQLQLLHDVFEKRKGMESSKDKLQLLLGESYVGEHTYWESLENSIMAVCELSKIWHTSGWGTFPENILSQLNAEVRTTYTFNHRHIRQLLETINTFANSPMNQFQPLQSKSVSLEEIVSWLAGFQAVGEDWLNTKRALESFRSNSSPLTWDVVKESFQRCNEIMMLQTEIESSRFVYERSMQHFYREDQTDWDQINASMKWAEGILNVLNCHIPEHLVSVLSEPTFASIRHQKLKEAVEVWEHSKAERDFLSSVFSYDSPLYAGKKWEEAHLGDIAEQLRLWAANSQALSDWLTFKRWNVEAELLGVVDFVKVRDSNDEREVLDASCLDMFRQRFYTLWLDYLYSQLDELPSFSVQKQESQISQFIEQDHRLGGVNSLRLFNKLIEQKQAYLKSPNTQRERQWFESELLKTRSRKTIRDFYRTVPELLLKIKPCVMMSPLTVSENIDPDTFRFDVVIFDESSQIRSEEAVGAILRGNQVIIAGDSKQMPPSNFFDSLNGGGNADEETDEEIYESILDECSAFLESRSLNWHYRSKHESLIAFSNKHIYDDGLMTFPSASNRMDEGISLIHVPNGVYDRGKSRKNVIEATRVAELVIEQLQRDPGHTLGVIAFSSAQEEAIVEQLEKIRKRYPELDSKFDEDVEEPFFVKNLENIQGHERDVIIFSIGYGKDKLGQISYNFGPLNRTGGERRLNVAVTRARYSIQVVSSLLDTDLEDSKLNKKGAQLLKKYLYFAKTRGAFTTSDYQGSSKMKEPTSVDEDIYDAIQSLGYKVVSGVGASDFGVDLAVVDPNEENQYILGILLDGNAYKSSRTVRDRERLRSSVLTSLGWNIHRVWSQSWVTNKISELRKIEQMINKGKMKN